MIKHLFTYFFFVQIALSIFTPAQIKDSSKIYLSPHDTLLATDSLQFTEKETVFIKKIDTIKILNTVPDSGSTKEVETTEKNLTDIDYWMEGINFFSILKFFIYILIGIGISKLIDFLRNFSLFKRFISRFPGIPFYFKTFIWIILGYNLFLMISANSKDMMLFIFMAFVSVIFISVIPFSKNIIGGFYLSLLKPFSLKDYIKIISGKSESYNVMGKVIGISWRVTELETDEGTKLIIPNSVFLDSVIENRIVEQSEKLVKIAFSFPMNYPSSLILKNLFEIAISSPYFYNKVPPKASISSIDNFNKIVHYQVEVYTFENSTEVDMINHLNHQVLLFTQNILDKQ